MSASYTGVELVETVTISLLDEEMEITMYCSNCGKELTEEARFCANCGQKKNDEATEPAVAERATAPTATTIRMPNPKILLGIVLAAAVIAGGFAISRSTGKNLMRSFPYQKGTEFTLTNPKLKVAEVVSDGDSLAAYLDLGTQQDFRGCIKATPDQVTVDFLDLGSDFMFVMMKPLVLVDTKTPEGTERQWSGVVFSNSFRPDDYDNGKAFMANITVRNRAETIGGQDCIRCDMTLAQQTSDYEEGNAEDVTIWYSRSNGIVKTTAKGKDFYMKPESE